MILSKVEQFGCVIVEKKNKEETVKIIYCEKNDGILFTFSLKLTIVVTSNEIQQQILDDNDV